MDLKIKDSIRIGIDIGGTFTDFVIYTPEIGKIDSFKILSSPKNPAEAVLQGIKYLNLSAPLQIIHGSTIATNALLERKGVKTALITTEGFKDILLIGRQNRPTLYDLAQVKPPPLIPSDLSYEISERVDSEGNILIPLQIENIKPIIESLIDNDVESVAISLLFSFLKPQHEINIAHNLQANGFFTSVSSEIAPEYREYERTSTTVVNAYVSPVLDQYLSTLCTQIKDSHIHILQSNGGMIGLDYARKNGVRCILSGPAGGVIGAQYLYQLAQPDGIKTSNTKPASIITFDMGGTSTDVSLIDRSPLLTHESSIGGYPICIPVLDIHTIGAGGGSIAYIDQGGALRVGPQSAGADPGPACYGRGKIPTVTDANVVLGRLIPEFFMGGNFVLDPDRSWSSIQQLGAQLGIDTIQCAKGIVTVANTHMEHALRAISVERGYDPRDFTLFSFGGAGGLHATELAHALLIPRLFISPYSSVLSALGMLAADIVLDYVQTVMLTSLIPVEKIELFFQPIINQGEAELISQGVDRSNIIIQLFVDARYQGQSYELTIPFFKGWDVFFHQEHEKVYGFKFHNNLIELVNIRVKAIGYTPHPIPKNRPKGTTNPDHALIGHKEVILEKHPVDIPCYQHENLEPGNLITGPAMIIRPDTTFLVGKADTVQIDGYNNLLIKTTQ